MIYGKKRIIAAISAVIFICTILCSCTITSNKDNSETKSESSDNTLSNDASTLTSSNASFEIPSLTSAQPGKTDEFITAQSGNVNTPSTSASAKSTNNKKASTTSSKSVSADVDDYVHNRNAAQRRFGFNKFYDYAANYLLFNIDELRTYFTYDNHDWLVEMWKGSYELVSLGAEIGVYYRNNTTNTPPQNPEKLHYNSVPDNEALYMQLDLWRIDSRGVKKLFTMPRVKYWWLAYFAGGALEKPTRRSDLCVVASIEFKNSAQFNAFLTSFKKKTAFTQKSSALTYKDADAFYINPSKNLFQISWRYYVD